LAIEIVQPLGPKELGTQKSPETDKTHPSENKGKAEPRYGQDQVKISERAKTRNRELQNLKTQAAALPHQSQSRIEAAKQRVADGFYLQDQVLETVADKVLQSEHLQPEIRNLHSQSPVTVSQDVPDVRSHKIALARSRQAEGYYQQQAVLTITAEKALKDILA
jgi:hypothetical protein